MTSTASAPPKQRVIRALRRTGALGAAERARFVYSLACNARSNRRFLAEHPGAVMPPAWELYDASNAVDYQGMWSSGQTRADLLAGVAREHLTVPAVVCDWGCGPGRVVRHLVANPAFSEVIGTDYNAASIKWCKANIPGATFVLNGVAPPFDIPAGSVDLMYGFSVFTHLSEQNCRDWMAELIRVTRPGGLIVITTHGDTFRRRLLPDEQYVYDTTGCVVRGEVLEGARLFATFHSPAYVRGTLASGLEVVEHRPAGAMAVSSGQDMWLLRRP